MAANLSPEDELYIKDLVSRGTYHSEAEALSAAVRLLRKSRQAVAAIQAGIEQAELGELIPSEDVLRRLEDRLAIIEAAIQTSP
jgi:putative addiction module CopG family antidote